MMVKRGIILSIVLVIGIAILVFLSNHSNSPVSPLNYPSSLTNPNIDLTKVIDISEKPLDPSLELQLKKGDTIKFFSGDKSYYLNLENVDNIIKKVDVSLNNVKYSIDVPGEKKIDLTGDENYDLLLSAKSISDDKATITLGNINEKEVSSDLVDSRVDSTLRDIEKNYKSQMEIFLYFLAFLMFLLAVYMIKVYLVPYILFRKSIERQKPTDALDYLFNEFNDAKREKDNEKMRKLYSRIRHLYEHMNNVEKDRYKDKMRDAKKILE
jgi:hypothetical protein